MSDEQKLMSIARSLITKTRIGNIAWEETADETVFQTSLEDYSINISHTRRGMASSYYELSIVNQKGRTIESLRTTIKEKDVTKLLAELYHLLTFESLM